MKNYKPDSLEYMLFAGRGRAIHDLLGKEMSQYRGMILDYCTHLRAYDRQLEGSRADYLYPLIQKSGESDFYFEKIIKALNDTDEMFDAEQLFDFAVMFFRDGYTKAGDAIADKFNKHDFDNLIGARHLIDIKGIDGLILGLDYIASQPDLHDDANIRYIGYTEEIYGEELVRQSLDAARKENDNLDRFLDHISDSYTTSLELNDIIRVNEGKTKFKEQIRDRYSLAKNMTWDQIKQQSDFHRLIKRWAKSAPDSEIEYAARDIPMEQDLEKLRWYLRIFGERPYPFHPVSLIELFDSPSLKVSNSALDALSRINHPDIRVLFDRLVQNREWAASAIHLLRSNYHDGDHLIIEALLEKEMDVDYLDDMIGSVCNTFESNSVPESLKSLLLAYEKSPCSFCRYNIVKLIDSLGKLPDWIIDECVYDSDEDLRALARDKSHGIA